MYERALRLMPGGVNSPVRSFGSVGGTPLFIERGEGAHIYDADGNAYLDFCCSWGALPVGHAHPKVVEAVQKAATRGTSFGAPHEGEVKLAEAVQARVPWVERLRLVSSGTEATMSAVRLARRATGRNLVLKFEGCYHGHADSVLPSSGSGVLFSPSGEITSPDLLVAPFNDLPSVKQIFSERGPEIAAIIVEPVAGNMGLIPPVGGFLEGLRTLTQSVGALLIFDEVMTGFRVHPAGAAGLFGIQPDLACFGKVIGGGLPVGAYGGRADLMAHVAPLGPVYQAGTLSGNPIGVASGLATLELLEEGAYAHMERLGAQLEEGLSQVGQVQRVGSMLSLFFSEGPVQNLTEAKASATGRYAPWFHGLLDRGFYLPPAPLESWFLSTAHREADISRLINSLS